MSVSSLPKSEGSRPCEAFFALESYPVPSFAAVRLGELESRHEKHSWSRKQAVLPAFLPWRSCDVL